VECCNLPALRPALLEEWLRLPGRAGAPAPSAPPTRHWLAAGPARAAHRRRPAHARAALDPHERLSLFGVLRVKHRLQGGAAAGAAGW